MADEPTLDLGPDPAPVVSPGLRPLEPPAAPAGPYFGPLTPNPLAPTMKPVDPQQVAMAPKPAATPVLRVPTPSGLSKEDFLNDVFWRESGGQNKYNYKYKLDPSYYTASGYYQITNSTWREGAKAAGVDLEKYPTAISATDHNIQRAVASAIYDKYGEKPWISSAHLSKGGRAGPPTFDGQEVNALGGGTGGSGSGLQLTGQGNPLGLVGGAATGQPLDTNGLITMALLSKLVPGTHTLQPVHYDPFVTPQQKSSFEPSLIKAPQLHPMPTSGEPVSQVRRVPMVPGASMGVQGLMQRVLGDTGAPSVRGQPGGAGKSAQYE